MKKKDLYDTLEIKKNATKEQIKKAYRKKSKEKHPDLNKNVKIEEFEKVKTAYLILYDNDKRKKYDETGEYSDDPIITKEQQIRNKMFEFIGQIFNQMIADFEDIKYDPIIDNIKRTIKLNLNTCEETLNKLEDEIKKLNKIKEKIKFNPDKIDSPNIFENIINHKINTTTKNIESIKIDQEAWSKSIEYFDMYKYKKEERDFEFIDNRNKLHFTGKTYAPYNDFMFQDKE